MHVNNYCYIKDAAKLTGLSPQIIRKWENRYRIVTPKRLENGYRLYSPDDLLTLRELKALREQGQSMKKAIKILSAREDDFRQVSASVTAEKSPFVEKMIMSDPLMMKSL